MDGAPAAASRSAATTPGLAGPAVVVAAAPGTADPRAPTSRRVNAAAVHINDAAPGTSPLPPAPNQDSSFELSPDTAPGALAAVITGADTAGPDTVGAATTIAGPPDGAGWEAIDDDAPADEEVVDDGTDESAAADGGTDTCGVTPADTDPAEDTPLAPVARSVPVDTGGCACSP